MALMLDFKDTMLNIPENELDRIRHELLIHVDKTRHGLLFSRLKESLQEEADDHGGWVQQLQPSFAYSGKSRHFCLASFLVFSPSLVAHLTSLRITPKQKKIH